MLIGSCKRISSIPNDDEMNGNIGAKEIKGTKTVKSLGVIIDENLSWKEHVDNICTKLFKAI